MKSSLGLIRPIPNLYIFKSPSNWESALQSIKTFASESFGFGLFLGGRLVIFEGTAH